MNRLNRLVGFDPKSMSLKKEIIDTIDTSLFLAPLFQNIYSYNTN